VQDVQRAAGLVRPFDQGRDRARIHGVEYRAVTPGRPPCVDLVAGRPACRISATSATTTRAPSRAICSAVARPMPDAAAVTIATFRSVWPCTFTPAGG
jgi:hypothetical protein